jgi:hypothetical protein
VPAETGVLPLRPLALPRSVLPKGLPPVVRGEVPSRLLSESVA